MKWATRVPDLPARADGGWCITSAVGGESSARYVRQYVEFLVDHKHLLQAGPTRA